MAKNNTSNILKEHDRVYGTRYKFSILAFIAVFISSIVTLVFVGKKGISSTMLLFLYVMAIASFAQTGLLIVDYALQKFTGKYVKALTYSSYAVGFIWIVALICEFLLGSIEVSALRIDLLVILAIQFALALTAYLLFPFMNRSFLSSMISKKMRDDSQEKARKMKAGRQIAIYALISILFVCMQAVTLLAYKIPPKFYDIFEDSRALSYTLTEDGSGYVVSGMYMGTTSKVVVPATYNDLPVVGINSGALVDDGLLEKYKIKEIILGTYTTDVDGNQVLESNIEYIEGGAISSNRIQSITMPESIKRIGTEAISSESLKKVIYSCAADFDINYLQCPSLENIIMQGNNVGKIQSIVGLPQNCYITISREIYDDYRRENPLYADNFRPDIGKDEYCIDFYTDCDDSYINSIIQTIGTSVTISIDNLVDTKNRSYKADTLAYITNKTEIGTAGVKENSAFRGWYFDKDFTSECVFSNSSNSVTISSDTAIYAKWVDEYTATLNWSTYTPRNNEITWDISDKYHTDDSKITKVHYTDDHVIDFPVVYNRLGYADGIAWSYNGEVVTNSSEVKGNVNLMGSWLLDAPEVSIDTSNRFGDNFTGYGNGVTFTFGFDEISGEINRSLYLAPVVSHDISVRYTYYWKRDDVEVNADSSNSVEIKRVGDSGQYTLRVQAKSATGEISEFTSEPVNITVNKKNIDNDVITLEYNVNGIKYGSDEKLVTDIKNANDFANQYDITYQYSLKQSDGTYSVINVNENTILEVGEYKVDVTVRRNDEYQGDYNPRVWSATSSINRREISITWEGDSFVYNGQNQHPTARIENDFGMEVIKSKVAYSSEAIESIDANNYVAEIYFKDGMEKNLTIASGSSLTKEYSITPLELKVDRWELDGQTGINALTYLGRDIEVKAYPNAGYIPSRDEGNVFFSFTGASINVAKNVSTNNLVEVNYIVDAEGVRNTNYAIVDGDSNNSFTWSINKKGLTAYQPTSANNYTYSGQEQKLQIYIEGFLGDDAQDALLTEFDQENFVSKEKISSSIIALSMTGKESGSSYTATLNAFNNDNYSLIGVGTYNFTINKKVLVLGENISDNDVVYSGNKVSKTYVLSGFVNGEAESFDKNSLVYENDGEFEIISNSENTGNAVAFTFTTPSKNVGVYSLAITGVKSGLGSSDVLRNYAWPTTGESEVTISIVPKVVEFNWFMQNDKLSGGESVAFTNNYTYNAATYTATAKASNLIGEDVVEATCSANTLLNAGNCSATVTAITGPDAGNYTIDGSSTSNKTFVVNKKTVSVSWLVCYGSVVEEYDSTKTYSYNKQAYILQPVFSGIEDGDVCNASDYTSNVKSNYGLSSFESEKNKVLNAGVYNVKVSSLDNSNYTLPTSQSYAVLTIDKKVAEFEWKISNNYTETVFDESQTYTYNKNAYTLSAIVTNVCDGDTVNASYSSGNALTDAGERTVYVAGLTGWDSSNYKLPATGTQKGLVVAKKTLEFTFNDYTATYNNSSYYVEPTVLNACSGDYVGFYYSSEVLDNYGQSTIGYSANYASRAGKYTITITGVTNNNYTLDGTASDLDALLTINKKEIEITYWTNTSITYCAYNVHPTPYLYGVYSSDNVNATYVTEDFENVGSYTVYANGISGTNSSNYTLKNTNLSCSFNIVKRDVTLNWSNVGQYNGQVQVPSVTSISNDAGLLGALTGYTGNTTAKVVGNNYKVKAVFNTDIVNNFNIYGIEKSFEITPRIVEITWSGSTSVTYDKTKHSLNAVVSNICVNNGDSVRVEYVADNGYTNAGTYTITVSNIVGTNASNYTIAGSSNLSRTLTINKKSVEFDWKLDGSAYNGVSINYDRSAHTLSAQANNLCSGDSVTITYNSTNSFVDAGTYTVKALISGNDNYVASSSNSKNLTINKKELSFNWKLDGNSYNGSSIVYDGQSHTITAVPSNVCVGDNVTIDYYSDNNFKNASVNTVKVYSVSNSNYQLPSNASVTFEITKKPLTITWDTASEFVYSGSAYAVSATINGVYSQDTNVALNYTIKNTGSGTTSTGNSATNAGNYLVTATLSHTNYMLSSSAQTTKAFTISPKTLSLRWMIDGSDYGTGEVVYDAQYHSLSASIVGVISSDSSYVSVSYYNNVSGKTVGSYTASISGLQGSKSSNYVLEDSTETTKSFNIVQRELLLSWNYDAPYEYTGYSLYPMATISSGLMSGDAVSLYYDSYEFVDVGSYTITAMVTNTNYKIVNATCNFEIIEKD